MTLLLLIALHTASAVIWVGGMFFALMVLRPAADGLDGPEKLKLWRRVFSQFFIWVWLAVILLLITGYWLLLVYFGGFKQAGTYIHLMNGFGLLMMALFSWLFFGPWQRFRQAVDSADFASAWPHMKGIRRIVIINLILGFTTIICGAAGPWLTGYM